MEVRPPSARRVGDSIDRVYLENFSKHWTGGHTTATAKNGIFTAPVGGCVLLNMRWYVVGTPRYVGVDQVLLAFVLVRDGAAIPDLSTGDTVAFCSISIGLLDWQEQSKNIVATDTDKIVFASDYSDMAQVTMEGGDRIVILDKSTKVNGAQALYQGRFSFEWITTSA